MRRVLPLSLLALTVPAVVIALPVVSAPTPTPHPVAPKTFHLPVAVGSGSLHSALAGGAVITTPQETSPAFRAVGISWKHDPAVTSVKAEIRVRAGGQWTAWQQVTSTDIGPDGAVDEPSTRQTADLRDGTEPLWVDHADGVQARIDSVVGDQPQDLRIDLVDPGTSTADATAGKTPAVASTAMAAASQPQILTRAQWGADESIRLNACPSGPEYTGAPKVAFVHHTVTGNGYAASDVPAIIRSIYAYHVQSEGWCDIGYNFLVDAYGRIWEGRYGGIDKAVLGAHTGGFNTNSFGVSLIGTFTSATPPAAMVSAVSSLIAWKLSLSYDNPVGQDTLTASAFSGSRYAAGTPVTLNVISGHRDVDLTDCPGSGAYALLPQIRQNVLADMGAGLVHPSDLVTAPRTVNSNGSVQITSGLLAAGDWQLTVQDSSGTTVRTITGSGSSINTAWPMTDDAGAPVAAGVYTLTLASTQNGQAARPWSAQVVVGGVFGSADSASASTGQVEIRGWAARAVDTAPAQLDITVDGATVGTTSTDTSRPDVGAVYPAYGSDRGYDVTEPAAPGYHTVCVYGDNSSIGLPNTRLGCLGATVPGAVSGNAMPVGNLEQAWTGPGSIAVVGWALDPDTSSPIAVHAYVDGIFWGAFTASGNRPDVGAAYPGEGSDHGYSLSLNGFLGGAHQVCVYAINAGGGTNPRIGCANVVNPGGNPRGDLNLAQGLPGAIRVAGWALDPDTPNPITVHVYVDGQWDGRTTASGNRPDVAAAFAGYGAAHGYDTTVPVSLGGTHQVCVYAINVGIGNTNPRLRCATVTLPSGNPKGSLDGASGQKGGAHIVGWSIDPDVVGPVQVHVYVDGRWTAALTADTARPDVGAAFPGYGADHGYDAVIGMSAGQHTVCTYAINVGGGTTNPLLGCRAVTAS